MTDAQSKETAGSSGAQSKSAAVPQTPPNAAPPKSRAASARRKWLLLPVFAVVGVAGFLGWKWLQPAKLPAGFVSSNGRIEATEIDVSTKLPGRILEELVDEGDFVTAGQIVARMDIKTLEAERREAVAKRDMAKHAVVAAKSLLAQRESEKTAAESVVAQRETERDLAERDLARMKKASESGAATVEELDTRRAQFRGAEAGVSSAKANVAAAAAAIATAKAQIVLAETNIASAEATIERIQADIDDSTLKATRAGRVQYRVAQPGEVLASGGKVMNMIDLSDVYMTFFLPEAAAGQVKQGAEVRLVLDPIPQYVIPATVTFVANVAQFTPKTVETAEERQKLMFRVKAHIDKELLRKYVRGVKTGVPGVAYVQLDRRAAWPANLEVKLPEWTITEWGTSEPSSQTSETTTSSQPATGPNP